MSALGPAVPRFLAGAVLFLSVVTFLLAAKAHGRQVRLERVRAGYTSVVFGGHNPPFVEALWRRDRIRFWSIALVGMALAGLIVAVGRTRGWPLPLGGGRLGTFWLVVFVPAVCAFIGCGLASLVGFIGTRDLDLRFTLAALPGSVAWWSAVLVALSVTVALAFRRPG